MFGAWNMQVFLFLLNFGYGSFKLKASSLVSFLTYGLQTTKNSSTRQSEN